MKTIKIYILRFITALLWSISISALAAGDNSCQLTSARTCIDGPATKMISGKAVFRDCWQYESKYNCASDNYTDQCQPLVAKGCTQIGSTCINFADDGTTCTLYEQKYQCIDKVGGTSQVMSCGGQTYCMDGNCFDASYAPDGDFGMAIAGLEMQRQMGNYIDPNNLTLFNGVGNDCSVTLGIFSCCGLNTKGGSDNSSTASQLAMSLAFNVGGEAIKYYGSYFVHDALYANGPLSWMQHGFESLFGEGFSSGTYTFNPAISLYGVTLGFSTSGIPSGLSMAQSLGGGFYIGFDPTSFAISIAFMVLQQLISCNKNEMILSMRRGQNLCSAVGSFCSSRVFGICVEVKHSYCCYNSKLARLISEAGHAQLGKSFGNPKSPDCGGFTTAEIAQIDFSKINFAEVINEVKAAVKTPAHAAGRANTMINNYYSPTPPPPSNSGP